MQLSSRSKNWLMVGLILISGLIGGVLGNWVYLYVLDTYYNIPQGNYNSSTGNGIIVRNPENIAFGNKVLEAVSMAENNVVGIFKRSDRYISDNKLSQGLVLTGDGWIVSTTWKEVPKKENWSNYTVVANDKKVYDIDQVIFDPVTQVTFIHLAKANNLPVKDFVSSYDLAVGQSLLALEWKGSIQAGVVAYISEASRSSETPLHEIRIDELTTTADIFLFDESGRVAGFSRDGKFFSMESVENIFNKFLVEGNLRYARLGVNYINLDTLPAEEGEGALLTTNSLIPAIIPGSPAQKIGLQSGDIITSIDDQTLNSINDLAVLLTERKSGDTVVLTVVRNKEMKRVSVVLDSKISQ